MKYSLTVHMNKNNDKNKHLQKYIEIYCPISEQSFLYFV